MDYFSFRKLKNDNLKDLIEPGRAGKKFLGPPQGMIGKKLLSPDDLLNIITGSASLGESINITITGKIYGREKVILSLGPKMGALGLFSLTEKSHKNFKYNGPTGYACMILENFPGIPEIQNEKPARAKEHHLFMADKAEDPEKDFNFLDNLKEIDTKKITRLIEFTEATKKQFELISEKRDSKTLFREKKKICEYLDLYINNLKTLKLVPHRKEETINNLRSISKNLYKSLKLLKEASEIIYTAPCLSCGENNPLSLSHCRNCNTPMAHFAGYINPRNKWTSIEDKDHGFCGSIISYNIQILAHNIEKYRTSKKNREEFYGDLEKFEESFKLLKNDFIKCKEKISKWKEERRLFKELILNSMDKGIKEISDASFKSFRDLYRFFEILLKLFIVSSFL